MPKSPPKVLYGLHFYDGTAEYRESGKQAYRIFLNEQTLRDMDPTFEGCPVYVRHREEVDLANLQTEADGYVINSFYNEADGKHWCKFIVVSDKGHAAIQNGWTLSNAYVPESFAPGGVWNGIDYAKQITKARYDHLAIVPDPRYAESIVLTPQEFKSYNESQISALKKVANSDKGERKMSKLFTLFKKTPVEQPDMGETIVRLEDGRELTVNELAALATKKEPTEMTSNASGQEKDEDKKEAEHKKENDAMSPADEDKDMKPEEGHKETEPEAEKHGRKDEPQKEHEAPAMANMDHHVMVGNKSMSVKDMAAEHGRMSKHFQDFSHFLKSYSNDEQMDGGEKDAAKGAQPADLTKKNADLDGGEKEAESQEAVADKTKRNSKFFDALKDAPMSVRSEPTVNLDQVARGKSRYGSN